MRGGPGLAVLQILTILTVAVFLATTMGHALELPGKMRLKREHYFAAQTIYWPGFTFIGGGAEVASIILSLLLALLTDWGTTAFWMVWASFLLLAVAHAIYWLLVHPVNKVWTRGMDLEGASRNFFAAGGEEEPEDDWTDLRERWEYAHATRAFLNFAALALLVSATAIS
jgi:Domain of unknown function (DUF1772)